MHADLDTLCTVVYCTADDLLPEGRRNARRRVTDAEVVTLCVAQAIMGIPSDRRFLAVAAERLGHLFPDLPASPPTTSAGAALRTRSNGSWASSPRRAPARDDLLLLDSTPVECGRSVRPPSVRRSRSRRLRLLRRPFPLVLGLAPASSLRPGRHSPGGRRSADPTPRRTGGGARAAERAARGGETLVCDKGYAGRSSRRRSDWAAIVRPARSDEPGRGPHLAPIRQRIESIFWTCKDLLTLERHGARTMAGLRDACSCASLPGRLYLSQPPAWSSQPGARRLLRLRLRRGINHLIWMWSSMGNAFGGRVAGVSDG